MNITQKEREELEMVARCGQPAYLRSKALVLLNLADGKSVSELALLFRVARQSIYNWRSCYMKHGIQGLMIRPGRGRKSKADLEELQWYVRQSPRTFGVCCTRWTLAMLAKVVPSVKGFSPYGVQKALRRAGFRYKRGQPWLHSPDPEYGKKKWLWTRP